MDEERRKRLIGDLYSTDEEGVRRAITALVHETPQHPALAWILRWHVTRSPEPLAGAAIDGLRLLPGSEAVEAIAAGLSASSPKTQWWAAYTLGEMAYIPRGRRAEVMAVMDRLIACTQEHLYESHVSASLVHALCKIGGPAATNQLIEIVGNESAPAMSRALALQGPSQDGNRLDFVERALGAIAGWSSRAARELAAESPFQTLPERIRNLVLTIAGADLPGGATVWIDVRLGPTESPSDAFATILRGSFRAYPDEADTLRSARFMLPRPEFARLIREAESGQLDQRLAAAGAGFVQEIISEPGCVYVHVPSAPVARTATIESVASAELAAVLPEVDLVLLTTTDVERKALHQVLRPLPGRAGLIEGDVGKVTCRVGQFGRYYAAHVECAMGAVGRASALLTVDHAIKEIEPKAILVLGIAFGIDRKRQRLGDVIVAESVISYEPARVGPQVQPRGEILTCGPILSERFRTRRMDWVEQRGIDQVRVFQGPLLSGEKLVDDVAFRDALVARFPAAQGGEMEGAGAYAAAQSAGVEILLVKSVCDFADGMKSDRAQPFASHTAVSLARHVLGKQDVLRELGARDRGPAP